MQTFPSLRFRFPEKGFPRDAGHRLRIADVISLATDIDSSVADIGFLAAGENFPATGKGFICTGFTLTITSEISVNDCHGCPGYMLLPEKKSDSEPKKDYGKGEEFVLPDPLPAKAKIVLFRKYICIKLFYTKLFTPYTHPDGTLWKKKLLLLTLLVNKAFVILVSERS